MTTPGLDSIQPLIIEERKVLTLGDDTFLMLSMSERNKALTENYRCLLHFELRAEVERVSVIDDNYCCFAVVEDLKLWTFALRFPLVLWVTGFWPQTHCSLLAFWLLS